VTSAVVEPVDRGAGATGEGTSRLRTRPSARDAAGFLLTALGGFVAAIGALLTWVTVGIPDESAHTEIRGVDLIEGRVVLLCAALVLGAVIAGRLARSVPGRRALAVLAATAGLAAAAIGASFLLHGADRPAVVAAVGIPRELWERFGVFRNVGIGPVLALVGGLASVTWGVLAVAGRRPVPSIAADAG
jgi:hypothetical protein